MTDATTSPWAQAWETTHKQATGSPATLFQGYTIYLAGGVPDHLDVEAGKISGIITSRHSEPTRATIRTTPFNQREEQTLIAALARSRHKDTLLKGQLPAELADPAQTGNIPIAPTAAQLTFTCSCQQAPCQHTAALGHAVTRRLQTSPSLLTTLRGLPPHRLTDLPHLPATPTTPTPSKENNHPGPPQRPTGPYVAAHQAYQNRKDGHPSTPPPRREPAGDDKAQFTQMTLPEPPAPAPSLEWLHHLTTEAARQAQQLLTGNALLETDPITHAVHLAASLPAKELTEDVAYRTGLELPAFRRLLTAYALAGTAGVHTARYSHSDDPHILQQAAAAIDPLRPDTSTPLTITDNRITDPTADLEVRHGQDGHWYPFVATGHDWQMIDHPTNDPASAYQNALTALHARTRPGR